MQESELRAFVSDGYLPVGLENSSQGLSCNNENTKEYSTMIKCASGHRRQSSKRENGLGFCAADRDGKLLSEVR